MLIPFQASNQIALMTCRVSHPSWYALVAS